MKAPPQTPRIKAKSVVALWLTFAAGMVDIVGYITVYHLFVAHMTGTTVHLGNELAIADWSEAAKAGAILFSFIIGSIVGRLVIEARSRQHKRTVASITLLVEATLVVAFIWSSEFMGNPGSPQLLSLPALCSLLALLSAAMGLQTAALTRIGPLTIHTTFVTGMLNKFAQAISDWLSWVYDEWKQNSGLGTILRRSSRHSAFRNAQFMSAIWFSYMTGSIAGTWMNSHWNTRTLYLPVILMLTSAVVDQFHPLSVEEEKEQA